MSKEILFLSRITSSLFHKYLAETYLSSHIIGSPIESDWTLKLSLLVCRDKLCFSCRSELPVMCDNGPITGDNKHVTITIVLLVLRYPHRVGGNTPQPLVLSTNIWQGMTIMSTGSLLSSQIFGWTLQVSFYLWGHDTLFLSILSTSEYVNTTLLVEEGDTFMKSEEWYCFNVVFHISWAK